MDQEEKKEDSEGYHLRASISADLQNGGELTQTWILDVNRSILTESDFRRKQMLRRKKRPSIKGREERKGKEESRKFSWTRKIGSRMSSASASLKFDENPESFDKIQSPVLLQSLE